MASDESVSTVASEASSSVGDSTSRARVRLYRKKLEDKEHELSDKMAAIANAQRQLEVKNRVIEERDAVVQVRDLYSRNINVICMPLRFV